MELCLLNLLILIDCFLCNSYPCVLFESLSHVINQESHVYSWNLGKIYLVHFLKLWNWNQNFKKVNSVNLSQISLLNMWLLVQICCIFSEHLFSRTPLSGCFWLVFNWFFFLVFVIPDILKAWIIFHSSSLGFLRKSLPKVFFLAQLGFGILYMFIACLWMQI